MMDELEGPQSLTPEPSPIALLPWLRERVAEHLGMATEKVPIDEPLVCLGLDSLAAVELQASIERQWGAALALPDLLQDMDLAAIARAVQAPPPDEPAAPPAEVPDGELATGTQPATPRLQRLPDRQRAPASFAQEALWFLARLEPGNPAYHLPAAVELQGPLDVAALAGALGVAVQRHAALRTRFTQVEGKLLQVIAPPPAGSPLPVVDLAALPPSRQLAEVRRRAEDLARRPFDLEHGPLLRPALWRIDDRRHVLALVLHHIVADGWSLELLARELSTAYAAWRRGQVPALPALPFQYGDFAAWQRSWLEGGELDRQLGYWRDALQGAPASLELLADRPRRAVRTWQGGQRVHRLPPALATGLAALGRRRGCTLFMTLLAAVTVLLARWAQQDEVVIGTPVANRGHREVQGLVGLFANTLALRIACGDAKSFGDHLGGVRQTALAGYGRQNLPFEKLIEELRLPRSAGSSPLIQVMVGLLRPPDAGLDLPGIVRSPFAVETRAAKFDLTLRFVPDAEGLAVQAEHAAVFDAVTIDRLLAHLGVLCHAAVRAPERSLQELPLTSAAEMHQLRCEWNDTARDPDATACIHGLFAQQAARVPDAIAVEAASELLSFGELAARAGRLARQLRQRGVGPEARVAVCLPRAVSQLVALVGVLEAGAAFVPLDPDWPAARLATVLADAGAGLALARGSLIDRLRAAAGIRCLDPEALAAAPVDGQLPEPAASPGNLAYVLFTSGSTGQPRGVMVEHRSVVNLAAALEQAVYGPAQLAASPSSRVAVNAPLTFDASVKQWVQLVHGRSLCLVPEEVRPEAGRMLAYLQERGVQVLDCTPGQLSYLVGAGLLRWPGSLELVLVGGEELPRPAWDELAGSPRPTFVNVYGPTECTVDATAAAVDGAAHGPVLGRPLGNVRVHLLDASLAAVPIGVAGEICIAGAGVARGYLAQPSLTADRFVPDPAPAAPGDRLYRSGDVARRLADGTVQFLGRRDRQVKVRGFRIEIGEIEAALGEHPWLAEAAVVATGEPAAGGLRLVAFATPGEGQVPAAADLRSWLERKLPVYMIPASFVVLGELPRTRHGKVDRVALLPLAAAAEQRRESAAPRDPLEQVLAGMMAEVLGLQQVGIFDDFFELGGHSLRAAELTAMFSDAFGFEVPLLAVFEQPTVAGLADLLRDHPEWARRVEELAPLLLQLTGEPMPAGERAGPLGEEP